MSQTGSADGQGDTVQDAVLDLIDSFRTRMRQEQGGVPTFYDNHVLVASRRLTNRYGSRLEALAWDKPWEELAENLDERDRRDLFELLQLASRRQDGRFVALEDRPEEREEASLVASQGTLDCLKWKDHLLFKSAFDVCIYQMLIWELRPKTILELGSGDGGSAIWMADLCRAFGIDCTVTSLDIRPPQFEYPGVQYLRGDCTRLSESLTPQILNGLARPWLVIEDVHLEVPNVLRYLHEYLQAGDYLVVEDSNTKVEEVRRFCEEFPATYGVDTQYTDFFGVNVTSSINSILKRM